MDPKHRHRRATRRGLAFEPLESRLLLSADLALAADALAAELSLVPAEHRAVDAAEPAPQVSMRIEAHEIVFVDGALADLDRLLADFVRATGPDRPVEVVVLDPGRDGLAQIGEALAARTGLTAVHVLSHGRDGAIELGATRLDAATLDARADAIGAWAEAFAADADLLLYGCDIADTVRGEGFLGELARLTGADVAASDDPTGAAARGGDWELEFATGAIETVLAPFVELAWGGLLATEVLDWDGGVAISQPGGAGTAYTTGAVSVGGGTVTVTVSGYAHDGTTGAVDSSVLGMLTSGTPVIDQAETGGLSPDQNALRLVSTGFEPDDPGNASDGWQGFLITIDFSHAGGVSNAGFSIFDIDVGGGSGGFVDEIVAISNQGAPTSTINGTRNTVIAAGVVRGTSSSPASQDFGNATFTFAQDGITQIRIFYKNAGGQTDQGIALHDIGFRVNDPPAVGGLGTLNYGENDAAAAIAAGATVTDGDSANFDTGTLTAAFTANGTAADQLGIRNQGTGPGEIGVSGASVTFGGVTIGTFAGGANGTSLVVTFNANATPAAAQALARNVTFASTSEDPSTLARTVRFTVTDGDGGSAFADATVNVAAANDAPVLAGANNLAGIAEDPAANLGTAVSVLIAGQITDVDAGPLAGIAVTAVDNASSAWEYSANGGGSWTAFGTPSVSAALLLRDSDLVRFVPAADWNGSATLSFRGWDQTSGAPGVTADTTTNGGTTAFSTAVRTSSITVTAVGDTVNDTAGTNEDAPVIVDVLANDSFENAGRTLTAVAGAANGTVGFTAAGAITYTANADWHGSETLTYTVTSNGVTETGTLSITVAAVGDTANDGVTVNEDSGTTVNVLANDNFESPGRTLIAVSAAANGAVGFTAAGAVTYTPNAHWSGTEVLTHTVSSGGVTETGTFTITVTPVADGPTLTVSAAAGDEDTAIALSVATGLVDSDGSETLALTVSSVPVGATLSDGGGNTFTASAGDTTATVTGWNLAALAVLPPLHSDVDFTLVIASTATEGANGAVAITSANLAVTVNAAADAPTLIVSPAAGNEDTAIALSVATAFVDTDGSETLALTVSSIPVGATLSDGANTFTATAGNTTATITGWNLATLTVLPPLHSDVDFTLAVAATATEGANAAVATTNANLAVTVDAVADAPTLTVNPATGNEDTAIALTVGTALVDTDGSETLSVAMSAIPIGAVITDGVNTFTASAGNQAANVTGWNLATLTVTSPADADTDFTLMLTATATEVANANAAASVAGLAVDVLPVNDAPTAAAPGVIDVVEDVPSPLLGISFADVDAGAGLVTATFTVAQGTLSAAGGGGVAVGGTATALTLTGALADVNAFLAGGGLAYTTVLDGNAPVALTASLNDLGNTGAGGPLASPDANVALNVIPVNDAPVLGSVALDIDAGGTVLLTAANMSATDVDDPHAGLVFFIANLANGRFELAGNPGVAVLAFTQAQVTSGQVKFVHTDPLRAPSYLVFVTDGASTVGPGVVGLTFRPLFVPGGGKSNDARDDAGVPAVSFASGAVDTSINGLADPFAIRFNRQPVVATEGGDAAIAEAEAVTPVAGSRLPVATPGNIFELRPRGIAYPELRFGEMDKLPTNIPPLDFGVGPQRPHEDPGGLDFAIDAIRTAGLVVSVGAVWWAARAAGLVSSLLAITPTWRHLDPLPVLGRDDDEAVGGDWDDPVGEEAAKEDASAN